MYEMQNRNIAMDKKYSIQKDNLIQHQLKTNNFFDRIFWYL